MKKLFLLLLMVFAILFNHSEARANKIMASDLTWTCVGQDSFMIKLVVYRDCNGDFLTSTPIKFVCIQTGVEIKFLPLSLGTPVDITPVCKESCTRCQSSSCSFPYGIHKYSMQGIVNLNNALSCCEIRLSWSQCCRNNSITTGAAGLNFYTEAMLNRCQNPCDNSPSFSTPPIALLCSGMDYTYFPDGKDIDFDPANRYLDSLQYELTAPLKAHADSITYTGQYSSTKPLYFKGFPNNKLNTPEGFHLAEQGILQFRPVKPEVSPLSLKITEYRKGKKIGDIRREMMFIVITCNPNHVPTLSTPNNITSKSVCPGSPVCFNFLTNDSDINDTLTISWNHAIPGAIWTDCNGQTKHPTGTLTWIPTENDSGIVHFFAVTVSDSVTCPAKGSVTKIYKITVKPHPQARIVTIDSCNGYYYFRAMQIYGHGPSFLWQGGNFLFKPNVGQITAHKFYQAGKYPYTMTMTASGCSKSYFDTIVHLPVIVKLPEDTAVCLYAHVNLNLKLDPVPRNYFVLWHSGSSVFSSDSAQLSLDITQDTTIIADVYKIKGCFAGSDTIHIKLDTCTSVMETNPEELISVSPNPASDYFIIAVESRALRIKKINLYNSIGKIELAKDGLKTSSYQVNIGGLQKGIYFLKIELNNDLVINKKLILN